MAGRHDRTTRVGLALAAGGIGVAGYLTYIHYADIAPACTTGGCEKVQSSEYSDLLGVPVALLGLLGYVLVLGALVVPGDLARASACFITLAGFGYLTYLELFEIGAICHWCMASAAIMTALALTTTLRWLRAPAT